MTWEERIAQYKIRSGTTPAPSFSYYDTRKYDLWQSYPQHPVSIYKTTPPSPSTPIFNALVAKIADFEKVNKHNLNVVNLKSRIKQLEDNYPIFDHKITSYTTFDFSRLGHGYGLFNMPRATIYGYQSFKNNKNVGTTLYLQAPYAVIPGAIKDIAAMEQRFNEDVVVREEIARRREQKASELMQSNEYKYLGIATEPLEKQRKPRHMITPENIKTQLDLRKTLVHAYYGDTQDSIFSLQPKYAIYEADRLIDRQLNPRKIVSSSTTTSASSSAPAIQQSDEDIAKRRKDTYNTVEKLRARTQHALSTAQKFGLNSYVPALERYLNDSLVIDTDTGGQQFDIRAKFPDQAVAAVEKEEYRRRKSADDQMLSQLERKIEPLEEHVFVKRDLRDTGAMFMLKKVSGANEMDEFLRRLG